MNLNLDTLSTSCNYPMSTLLYGPPKVGKTFATSLLPRHYIMEMDPSGAAYSPCYHNQYNTKAEFLEGLLALESTPPDRKPKFLIVDTVDRLEDFAAIMAVEAHSKRFPKEAVKSPADLLALPYGLGYGYLREAFSLLLDAIFSLKIPTIFLGHVKPKALDKEVRESATEDLALTGKVRDILCAAVDMIGFCTRNKKGELIVSTRTSDTVNCGCRLEHLSGKDISLVTPVNGKLTGNWKQIYGDLLA